jgi:hypothetical protein
VNEDRGIGAMPKLYGAPAYARPKVETINVTGRPFDPDDLPIEAHRASEAEQAGEPPPEMHATPYPSTAPAAISGTPTAKAHKKRRSIIQARPFRLKRPSKSNGSGEG